MNAISQNDRAIETRFIDAFHFRHATKIFDPDRKIPDSQFATILEAARLSPTSFGHEPFKILVIQTPEKRELFREFSWGANGMMNGSAGQLGTASHFGIILASTAKTMSAGSDYQVVTKKAALTMQGQQTTDLRFSYSGVGVYKNIDRT